MIFRWLNQIRCYLASRLLDSHLPKHIFLARWIGPDTTSLIRHRPRSPKPLVLPEVSHLIYHQGTVDEQCALNCAKTLDDQIPLDDEVLFLDVGNNLSPAFLQNLRPRDWYQYAGCRAPLPEQRSYTFGLNATLSRLRGKHLIVWRTDYIYPECFYSRYMDCFRSGKRFACPDSVIVGNAKSNSAFVAEHSKKFRPYDESFWASHGEPLSLYTTQDPALFAIHRDLWNKIGGLNHELWGYGWQFAEFAARIRTGCPANRIAYFKSPPPFHQTHGGSLMHLPTDKSAEFDEGAKRFANFLGGEHAYHIYRLNQYLPPPRHPQ